MKPIILFILMVLSGLVNAQKTTKVSQTLERQFDSIYNASNSYGKYKIVKEFHLQDLKLQTLDSLNKYKKALSEKEMLLNTEKENFIKVQKEGIKTQLALDNALKKENLISLFGIELSKINYNILLWSIIIIQLLSLSYFIFKIKNNTQLTKEAKASFIEVEEELLLFRKKSLEKEQKLRRKLQDEINKQRNS